MSVSSGPTVPGRLKGKESQTRISVVITRVKVDDLAPENFVEQQAKQLDQAVKGLKVVARGTWEHPHYGPQPALESTFNAPYGGKAAQAQIYVQRPETNDALIVTFSAAAMAYDQVKEQFQALFESLALD